VTTGLDLLERTSERRKNSVSAVSALPFFGLPGLVLLALGLTLGVLVIGIYLGPAEPGIGPGLVTFLLIMSGMLLALMGVILHALVNADRRSP